MANQHNPLAERVEQLRDELQHRDCAQLAVQTGTTFHPAGEDNGFFTFPYWGEETVLPCADYVARDRSSDQPLGLLDQAMIAYYFHESKGSPDPGGWIAFSELPDGQFYASAFKGYTAKKILQKFGSDYRAFENKSLELNGKRVGFASGAFVYQILPQTAVMAAYWRGDEDFSPSYQLLFSDTVSCHLPTDACAILGSMLTGRYLS